ncbi:MAG: prohibitin family protein [Oscillospiraceae bacterium]|nr:prohibitin family protein [Oscillospiraceae bacterium]
MSWVVIAILAAIVVFIICGVRTERRNTTDRMGNSVIRTEKHFKVTKRCFLALLPLILIIGGCISAIPAGHTGVLTTFGRVEDKVLSEGVNFKLPYQTVIKIDNRVQKESFVLEAFSSDIQQTNVIGSVNFSVDKTQSQNLYRSVGVNYYQTVIYPRVLENVKLVFSGYTAEGLIEMRTVLSSKTKELLTAEMSKYGINIIDVNIENIDFTDIFTNAVEAKQVAQQNKLTTQTEQEAAIIIANTEAEKKVIAAQAEAETAKIAADAEAYKVRVEAEAKAKANEEVANSLTEMFIEYTKIMNWDGSVPNVQLGSGDGVIPVIDIPVDTGD